MQSDLDNQKLTKLQTFSVLIALSALGLHAQLDAQQALVDATGSSAEAERVFANQRDPKVVSDGWKHFYFHRPKTTYDEAMADLSECYQLAELPDSWGMVPTFVDWNHRPNPVKSAPNPMISGILPALIGPAIIRTQNRRAMQSRLRRCMEPRGYQRYPLSEVDWHWLIADFSPATLPRQARLMSGPAPDAAPLPASK